MRIYVTSVFVEDQSKALDFYTEKLGFEKKEDIPLGDDRWLTVVSTENREGVELMLEPSHHPAVKPFKESLVEDGIPFASFEVDNLFNEYRRLCKLEVEFTQEPTDSESASTAVFNDTCGNLIQLMQRK